MFAMSAHARPASSAPSVDKGGMDPSVSAGDDFFAYCNGVWDKKTPIPPDRAGFGVMAVVDDLTTRRTNDLIVAADKSNAAPGSEARKLSDYYQSFLDQAAIEAKGAAPLAPALQRIDAVKDVAGLSRALGETLRADVDVLNNSQFDTPNLFGLWVAQDLSDPAHYSPFLLQGGLSMPDRDYYRDGSPRMSEIRRKYEAHIANMLTLAGVPDAKAKAKSILALERKIADAHAPRVETEDVEKGNNHWKRSDFQARAPGLDWNAFFLAAGLGNQPVFVVWQEKALIAEAALVSSVALQTWKDYLAYHVVDHHAQVLPKRFDDESFAFYGQVITGTPMQRERWKRAVNSTDQALGEAVGKLYVAKYFPPSEKARAAEMVRNIMTAFAKRIDRLDWMAPATKEKAKAKLAVLKVGVGYPDKWRDYSGLEVARGDAYGNFDRHEKFELAAARRRLGQPVDRGEWVMNPQLVNAVNLPAMNALNFPAAILQPPFFDPKRAAVMDYGAAGAVIGHEISHSFDDQGALFDADGRFKNWWTREDFAHFKASGAKLAAQFDAYQPFSDMHVNGKLTSSENIADVAGLAASYDAYRISLGGKEAPAQDGFKGDQLFFISFAQTWRTKLREPAARARLLTDGHAPPQYRADTARNLDAWYDAFAVKPGLKLYLAPADRVKVW
jgi:predicted metalloendopeptidase